MTGGAHDTNGPKNGIIWSSPAATDVRAASGRPSDAGSSPSATRK